MFKKNMTIGKLVGIVGWLLTIWAVLRYAYAYYDIYSDVSVRAFAPLVLIEGGFYLVIGLVLVFVGRRVERRLGDKDRQSDEA